VTADRLVVDTAAASRAAALLNRAAAGNWRMVVDGAASGSPSVTNAIEDFTMWVSSALLGLTDRTVQLGKDATVAADSFAQVDRALAGVAAQAGIATMAAGSMPVAG